MTASHAQRHDDFRSVCRADWRSELVPVDAARLEVIQDVAARRNPGLVRMRAILVARSALSVPTRMVVAAAQPKAR